MSSRGPFVSVIVPIYGEVRDFGKSLTALHEQSYPRNYYEVIIVDNGAFPTPQVHEFSNFVLVKESKKGSYCARNTGLAYAKGDIYAFTDADCIPHRTWIEQGVKAIQRSRRMGLVAGRIDVSYANSDHPSATEIYDRLVSFSQELTLTRYHYGATANLFTTRSVVEQVGRFDDSHLSGGDCEWGRRVFEYDLRQEYCDSAVVQHPARKSLSALISKSRRVTIGTRHSLAHKDGETWSVSSWYYHLFRRPVGLWLQMLDKDLAAGIGMRFRVIGIYYFIKLLQVTERVRVLVLGGEPQR